MSPSPTAPTAIGALKAAQHLLDDPDVLPSAARAQAVAVLARLAIERGMVDLWSVTRPELTANRNKKAQFICLRVDSGIDPDLAGRTHFTWAALSAACHHHVYELPPTDVELRAWVETAEEFLRAVGAVLARQQPTGARSR